MAIPVFLLAYPLYIIRPFRSRGRTELQAALFVLQYRYIAEWICVAGTIAAVWKRSPAN